MLGVGVLVHFEDEVGQRSCLCHLPVNTDDLDRGGGSSHVEDEVTNLSEKVVLVCPPAVTVVAVGITLNHPRVLEVSAGNECGQIISISN